MLLNEMHRSDSYYESLNEAFSIKTFFKNVKLKLINVKDKLFKPSGTHSSGTDSSSVSEMVKELSFYDDTEDYLNEFSFGFKPKVTYNELEKILNYFYQSAQHNFDFVFNSFDICLDYAIRALKAKTEEEVKSYVNDVVKSVNEEANKKHQFCDKTLEYDKKLRKLTAKDCKYIVDQLSESELSNLSKLCKDLDKKFKDLYTNCSKKMTLYSLKSSKIKNDFDKLVMNKAYEQRCVTCATIMGNIFEGSIMEEYKATYNDCVYSINDVNYIYKNIKGSLGESAEIDDLFNFSFDEPFTDEF